MVRDNMSHCNTQLTVQTCTPKYMSITHLSKPSHEFHSKTFSNLCASFYTFINIFSPLKWSVLTHLLPRTQEFMTFVLKRKPQTSIKTGITWKALLKLHLYFRIPFEMYTHCVSENWKVYNIWNLLGPLACTYAQLPAICLNFLFE